MPIYFVKYFQRASSHEGEINLHFFFGHPQGVFPSFGLNFFCGKMEICLNCKYLFAIKAKASHLHLKRFCNLL